jgi:phage repressor protein C with HTH and peptisase S24 domain
MFLWCAVIDRDRLIAEMQKQGVTQAALARAVGVSAASVQQILNGSVKSPRSTRKIAEALGVSVDWLEGVSDDPKRVYLEDVEQDDVTPAGFQYLAKNDVDSSDRVTTKVILFSKSWIERIAGTSNYEDIVVFRIGGSDMAPTLTSGDEVILAKQEFDSHPDSIWFFDYGGEMFIRRVRRVSPGRVAVSADNPAFPTFEAMEDDVRFLGRLVWHGRKLGP